MDQPPPQPEQPRQPSQPQYQQPYQPSQIPPPGTQPPPGQYPPPGTYPPHYQPPPAPVQNNNTKLIWIIVGIACGCPVLVILIGIIAAVAIPMYMAAKDVDDSQTAKTYLRTVSSAEAAYYAQYGEYGGILELTSGRYLGYPVTGEQAEPEPGVVITIEILESGQAYEAKAADDDIVYVCDHTGEIRELD